MKGIAEMFAELDGRQRYVDAFEIHAARARSDAVERTAQWRKANPKRAREILRASKRRWEARNPEHARASRRRRSALYRARKRSVAVEASEATR